MKKPFLEAGEFVTTHGITGELRLYPWSDNPDFLLHFATIYADADGRSPLSIAQIRPHKNICIVKLEGIDSIEAARPYIGKTVWISREEAGLPAGRWFVQDILGARVVNADTGEEYGVIAAVTHPGRHDVFEVKRPDGSVSLFPATAPFLIKVDLDSGEVLIRPIEGMFEPPTQKESAE